MPWKKAIASHFSVVAKKINRSLFILLGYKTVTACKENSYRFILDKEKPICKDCKSEISFWNAQKYFQKGKENKISLDGNFMEISMLSSWE